MGLKKNAFSLLAGILLTSSVSMAKSERLNPSISYGETVRFPSGAMENYDPLRFRLGFEYDSSDDYWFFNKYTVTPFVSYIKEKTDAGENKRDWDAGIDFGLKRIFSEGKNVSFFVHPSLGAIYLNKYLKEHARKWNFHLNFETGFEVELAGDFNLTTSVGYDHSSIGKKIKNNILNTTTNGDNEGNPGVNTIYFSLGLAF